MEKKTMILATISIGAFMVSLDSSIVNIALPTLVKTFNTGFEETRWVVLIYLFIITTLILPFGRLGDVIGKKKIYLTGYTVFTISSLLCGMADSLNYLILSRIAQGIGGAMLMSLGLAIITETFAPKERGKALGILAMAASIAIITGPVAGGIILEYFSWRCIFYINLPIGIFGIYMTKKFIKTDHNKKKEVFNLKSASALFVFFISLLAAITSTDKSGIDTFVPGFFLVAAVFFIVFVKCELQSGNPMMDIRLFKNKRFSIGLISGMIVFVSLSGVHILLPFYLETIRGFKSGKSGLMIAIIPVFMGISSIIAGFLADKFDSNKITIAGIIILLAGFAAISGLSSDTVVTDFAIRLILIGTGMGFFMTPNTTGIMETIPRKRLGISSGMLALSRSLGQASGVALLGVYWVRKTIVYSNSGQNEINAKVMAFQTTFTLVTILMGFILLLNLYGMINTKKIVKEPLINNFTL